MSNGVSTIVTLILTSKAGSETFSGYSGPIPRVGEYVTFYKYQHDGGVYGGTVKRVTHRIEPIAQNSSRTQAESTVTVHLKGHLRWIL